MTENTKSMDISSVILAEAWKGHAPDLVRDNRLMHERIAEQDREIQRLTELLRIAESKAIHTPKPRCWWPECKETTGEALVDACNRALQPHCHRCDGKKLIVSNQLTGHWIPCPDCSAEPSGG